MSNPNEWRPHITTKAPEGVNPDALIEVKSKNGNVDKRRLGAFVWNLLASNPWSITHWRYVNTSDGVVPDTLVKQARYKREDGTDTIDKWEREYTLEEFRVIMWVMMDKYHDRLGKKDSYAKEVRKIADYANRWALVEEAKEQKQ